MYFYIHIILQNTCCAVEVGNGEAMNKRWVNSVIINVQNVIKEIIRNAVCRVLKIEVQVKKHVCTQQSIVPND